MAKVHAMESVAQSKDQQQKPVFNDQHTPRLSQHMKCFPTVHLPLRAFIFCTSQTRIFTIARRSYMEGSHVPQRSREGNATPSSLQTYISDPDGSVRHLLQHSTTNSANRNGKGCWS